MGRGLPPYRRLVEGICGVGSRQQHLHAPYYRLAGESISKLSEFGCVQGIHLTFRLRTLEPVRTVGAQAYVQPVES